MKDPAAGGEAEPAKDVEMDDAEKAAAEKDEAVKKVAEAASKAAEAARKAFE